jgi:hypothetical protein
MTSTPRDDNRIPTLLGTLNTNGLTPVSVEASPTLNALNVSNGTTGTDHGRSDAVRDDNRIPVLLAVSSADGVTPIEVYCDSNGNLLIQSN